LAQETAANLPGVTNVDNRLELKAEYPAEKSNEWLALKVRAAILFHRNVSAEKTHVYVEEGIVTIRGEASSEAQKELTTEYANVEGAKEVRNEMTVAKTPKNEGRTMQEKIDDASITAQVKMALLFHHATSALKTSVSTKDGIVTVSGKAANAAEKDLVTKLVNDIHGVNSVVNNMTVEQA
jgi:osmotically-inducible protein OsmY